MNNYPPFIPPPDIGEAQPDTWSKDQAKTYFDWLIHIIPGRVTSLLEYFGESADTAPEILLYQLGKKVGDAAKSGEFVQAGKLTKSGFAVAADLGLLVAQLLLADSGVCAKWVLVTQKRSVHYNHPVIQGNSNLQLNPITGSMTEFAYATRNQWDSAIWLNTFLHWKSVFSK